MRKSCKIISVMLFLIMLLTVTSNAEQSFTFETDPVEKVVEPGETVEIRLSAKDITEIEEGINTIVGYVDYEEDLFESIDFSGIEKWEVTYNNRSNSELYGKFAITTMQNGVLADTNVAVLTLKLKGGLPDGETEVVFKKLVSSDGYTSIQEDDKVVKLIIKNPEKKPAPQKEQKQEPATNTVTGDQIFLYIGIIVLVVVVWVVIIVIGKTKDKKEKEDE